MARVPIMAAGGIVLRRQQPPVIAVVRLRKRDEWVLPKGKLDSGETPRAAAKREVLEETGHDVTMHEFLGTLVYDSGGRSKVVHYWRMEACGGPTRELMNDVRAVDWLPLDAALARLSRGHERAFLENVGPMALEAFSRRPKPKPPASKKRRSRPPAAPALPPAEPAMPLSSRPAMDPQPVVAEHNSLVLDDVATMEDAVDMEEAVEPGDIPLPEQAAEPDVSSDDVAEAADGDEPCDAESDDRNEDEPDVAQNRPRSLAQKVREWLGRAA